MPVACFPAVGESMERRLRLKRAVDKFHLLCCATQFCKALQNAFDPDLTQTGNFSEFTVCAGWTAVVQYVDM